MLIINNINAFYLRYKLHYACHARKCKTLNLFFDEGFNTIFSVQVSAINTAKIIMA